MKRLLFKFHCYVFHQDRGNVTRLNHVIYIRIGKRHTASKSRNQGTIIVSNINEYLFNTIY